MSNSRKKTAVDFGLFVNSEKADKRRLNKAVRRATKAMTKYQLSLEFAKQGDFEELELLPVDTDAIAQQNFGKSSKRFFRVAQFVEFFRDNICKKILTPAQLALISLTESEQLEIEAERWYREALRK